MVRRVYKPKAVQGVDALAALDRALADCGLDADALLARYCTRVYAQTGSFVETGRRLGLDRRTVKEHVDSTLLAEFQRRG